MHWTDIWILEGRGNDADSNRLQNFIKSYGILRTMIDF